MMVQQRESFSQIVLMVCSSLLALLMCSGCLAAMAYRELESDEYLVGKECTEEVEQHHNILLEGEYLGIEDHKGTLMYHYQFLGVLQGDNRCLHILVNTDFNHCFAKEAKRIKRNDARPAWLIANAEKNEKRYGELLLEVPLPEKQDYIPCLAISSFDYEWFDLWNPFDDEKDNYWCGDVYVSWKVRSRLRHAGKEILANAASIACVPVDAVLIVLSPIWLPPLLMAINNTHIW